MLSPNFYEQDDQNSLYKKSNADLLNIREIKPIEAKVHQKVKSKVSQKLHKEMMGKIEGSGTKANKSIVTDFVISYKSKTPTTATGLNISFMDQAKQAANAFAKIDQELGKVDLDKKVEADEKIIFVANVEKKKRQSI